MPRKFKSKSNTPASSSASAQMRSSRLAPQAAPRALLAPDNAPNLSRVHQERHVHQVHQVHQVTEVTQVTHFNWATQTRVTQLHYALSHCQHLAQYCTTSRQDEPIQQMMPGLHQPSSPGFLQPSSPGLFQPSSPGFLQPSSPGLLQPSSPGLLQPSSLGLQPSSPNHEPQSVTGLTNLPGEVLDQIFNYVYLGSGGHLDSILAVSRTCRSLRVHAYPILFEKITVRADEDVIQRRSWPLLEGLMFSPDLLRHVRTLEIQPPPRYHHPDIDAFLGQKLNRYRLMQCLSQMTGLQYLRLHGLSDMNLDILEHIPWDSSLHLTLDMCRWEAGLGNVQIRRLHAILASAPGWTCGLSLPWSKHVQDTEGTLGQLSVVSKITALDWADNWNVLRGPGVGRERFAHLEELHICSWPSKLEDRSLVQSLIPWQKLKRLHVEGDRPIQNLLSSVIGQLKNIEDLRLIGATTEAFHEGCSSGHGNLPLTNLAYTQLQSLRNLSLSSICPHYHIRQLTAPNLRSLALVLPEYQARLANFSERRHPSEIQWLASNVPHLQHLELHIGSLHNLWHQTALSTPEADARIEVEATLSSIAQIPNLKSLRLFPPYVPKDEHHNILNARQPLKDEQAVHLYHHLRSKQPGLRVLAFAATFHQLEGFNPTSWLVHDGGSSRTVLKTRETGKDYDIEQLWFGLRRNSMALRQHHVQKPYLADMLGGWGFSVRDPFM